MSRLSLSPFISLSMSPSCLSASVNRFLASSAVWMSCWVRSSHLYSSSAFFSDSLGSLWSLMS